MRLPLFLFAVVSLIIASVSPARADWALDGSPVSAAANAQINPTIVSDGAGGAIIAWQDYRGGTNLDIYAQRVDGSGTPLWTVDGVAVCTAANSQYSPVMVSDGAGGAILTWYDKRNGADYDIYAQRVNASGVSLWTANGVALCTAASDQFASTIVTDGTGGAIVTWEDFRSSANYDIYAQRVNASGTALWTADGVALCAAAGDQLNPAIASDEVGGVVVTWGDYRSGTSYDIYAQRVSISGAPQWTADGVTLCTATGDQSYPMITSDGAGGGIVTWQDYRSGTSDVYAQRVNSSGVPLWFSDGVVLCDAASDQTYPKIVSDGTGGAIVTWYDFRSSTNGDIYARRVSAAGFPQWTADGVALCTAANDQSGQTIFSDGAGGAIIAWQDSRSGTNSDLYAQRTNAAGVPQWTADGVALCTVVGAQGTSVIASDGTDGAIVAWSDFRTVAGDVYAQRIEGHYGEWGRPEPTIMSVEDNPDDQGGKVVVRWAASQRDTYNNPLISYYSVWRATDAALVSGKGPATTSMHIISDPREITADFSGSALWEVPTPSGPQYWEWVANQDATYQSTYSILASTREDSVAGNPAEHYFKVLAHESTTPKSPIWESGTVSGHSVDNIAPSAPLTLTAQRVGSNVELAWNASSSPAPDFRDYSVYRATSSGVMPVPVNFVSSASLTSLLDINPPTSVLYYIVTAVDEHGNQSTPSNEASVAGLGATGVDDTPAITALTVLPNTPNPFTGNTTLSIGLPKASDIEVDVYDVAGQRVRVEELPRQGAGWRSVDFDGHDDAGRSLASGVYFYRVHAAGTTVTRKMILVR